MGDTPGLRIGVLIEEQYPLHAWQSWCIEHLLTLPAVEVVGVIRVTHQGAGATREGTRSRNLWRLVEGCVVRWRTPAIRHVGLPTSIDPAARILLDGGPSDSRGGLSPTAESVARVRDCSLDVLLSFSPRQVSGELASVPRYGVWSFRLSAKARCIEDVPGLYEMLEGDRTTEIVLSRASGEPGQDMVLYRGSFRTIGYSLRVHVDRMLRACARWPMRACLGLQHGVASFASGEALSSPPPQAALPTNKETLTLATRVLRSMLCRGLQRHDKWNVGIIKEPIHCLLSSPPRNVHWLPEKRDYVFLADPFACRRDGGTKILAEEYDYRSGKGRVVVVDRPDEGPPTSPEVAIEFPYHTAYPYLFEHGGHLYCIPETSAAGNVVLYRSKDRCCREWAVEAVLMADFPAVDPTVFEHDGRWWMLCTHKEYGDNGELHAFYADDLLGPWSPHVGNPVKTDDSSSRPAGTPFTHEGRLYRPAQDCSSGYGLRVVLNEIVRLTPTEFDEHVVTTVAPDASGPYPDGLHTISTAGDWTVIDGKRRIFSPGVLLLRIVRHRS